LPYGNILLLWGDSIHSAQTHAVPAPTAVPPAADDRMGAHSARRSPVSEGSISGQQALRPRGQRRLRHGTPNGDATQHDAQRLVAPLAECLA
jgi:hypothetical protein